MEEIRVEIPGGGELKALRLQDLPAEHVTAWHAMPPGIKEAMGIKLFALAVGQSGEEFLVGLTFAELERLVVDWMFQSAESDEMDADGRGAGIDWSELLR